MKKEEYLAFASMEYDHWASSQEVQTDAHEFERSFSELMERFSNRLFQLSVGPIPSDRRKKNDSHPVWAD